ncbi:MAG TPA: hypothetical protein VG674_00060 [Amycolatopsis sp.]|nr:hypothetical protein [Amycolatopsis sp.]
MVNTDPEFFAGLAEEFFEGDGIHLLTDVANWADLCTAPRGTPVQHPDSGINNQVYREETAMGPSAFDNRPATLPMANLAIENFFTAARLLSGPVLADFGAEGAPHRLLQGAFVNLGTNLTNRPGGETDPDGGMMGLHDALERLFDHWRGDAAEACKDYAGAIYTFMAHELAVIAALVDAITAYSSIVLAGRKRLIGLMRAFVGAMRAKEAEDVANAQQFPWGLVFAAGAMLVTMGFGLAAVATAVVAEGTEIAVAAGLNEVLPPLASMVATTADKLLDGGDKTIPATDYAVAAQAYLDAANQVVDDTRAAVEPLTKQITDALDRFMDPPAPPLTKVKFEADNHSLEPGTT